MGEKKELSISSFQTMCEITSATITKVQNVILLGGEGVRKAEKQVCQLATLGIKGLKKLIFGGSLEDVVPLNHVQLYYLSFKYLQI